MKFKKLHMIGSLLAAGIAITTLSSNSTGITGQYATGCGGSGCHGSQDAAAVITVTGLPASWTAGTTYPVTLKVTNASETKAGFDLKVSIGTISGGSAGTSISGGTEIHHITPQTLTSGSATWTFNWTAPATAGAALSLNVACNTVNGNAVQDAGDHWNKAAISVPAAPASIAPLSEGGFSVYPNPATDHLVLATGGGREVAISAVSAGGDFVALPSSRMAEGKYQINTSGLAAGMYVLLLDANGKRYATRFVKQ